MECTARWDEVPFPKAAGGQELVGLRAIMKEGALSEEEGLHNGVGTYPNGVPYPCQYELGKQPTTDNGKLIWVTGATGAGKTAISTRLRERGDWVCYEGDCFMFHLNPYTDEAPNGAGGGTPMKPERLVGLPADRIRACEDALKQGFMKVTAGARVDFSVWKRFYHELCADVQRERQRLGTGHNFVIAQAVYSRQARELIRSLLGPELLFVMLHVPLDLQAERIAERFGMPASAAEGMKRHCRGFEPAEPGEESTLCLRVERGKPAEAMAEELLAYLDRK